MDDKELYIRFTKQLSEWSRTGKEPALGDWNVRAYLDAQEQRLKKKGIKRWFNFEPKSNVFRIGDFTVGTILNAYNKRVNYSLGQKRICYIYNKETIYDEEKEAALYQLIKQPSEENSTWKNETYVCPNCGYIAKISEFENDGCPYCNTKFLVSELYPKVTNFYMLDTALDKKFSFQKVFTLIKWCIIIAAILTSVLMLPSFMPDLKTGFNLIEEYGLLQIFVMLCGGAFLWGIFLWPVIFPAADSMQVLKGSAGAKSKITKKVQKYDSSFSYDYFEGKALSLLRMIAYADNPIEFIQYEGTDIDASWNDVVDMEYRGGLGIDSISQEGEYLNAKLKVYMKNTYFINEKIKTKNEIINLHLRHNTRWSIVPEFSIKKVECHSCGSSFDATKHRYCPSCNQKYDVGMDDWIVLDISK